MVIKLDDGRSLLFAHLDVHGEHQDLNEGNKIKIGDTIGRIGNTGIGTAPHLHLEVITPAGTTLIERGSFPAPQTERENPIEYLTRTNSLRPGKRQ